MPSKKKPTAASGKTPTASNQPTMSAAKATVTAWFERWKQLLCPAWTAWTAWRETIAIPTNVRRYARFGGAGLVAVIIVLSGYLWAIHRPLDFGEQTWAIQSGDTLKQVATQLVERGVIDQKWVLTLLAGDRDRHIRPGEYRFPPGTSLDDFMQSIVRGRSQIGIKVTILEGWTFRQMRAHLRKARKLKADTAGLSDQQIMAQLGHPELHPEGRFFPDTYTYTAGESDLSIYRKAFELMQKKLDYAWENRDDDLILADKDEALIMASIIEKESWVAEEKRKIAGVFYNRLKKKMRLQTDPTVIYGLGAKFNGNLTRAHLKADTPYNTYTRKGFPPTPISLPGDDSLAATMHPEHTDAYYFVAKGGGLHQFSVTLAQHNKAVWEHIRRARRNKKTQ